MRLPQQSPPVSRGICSSFQSGVDCSVSASTDEVYAAAGGKKAQFNCPAAGKLQVQGKGCSDPTTLDHACIPPVPATGFVDGVALLDGVEI